MNVFLPVVLIACIMIIIEVISPGRAWQKTPNWLLRATLLNIVQASCAFIGGRTWDVWLNGFHAFDLSRMNIIPSAIIGYVVITFIFYWWHRARHEIAFLWRWCHQIHHSPQRIEILTSFYKHPIEIIVNSVLCSFILYSLLGLTPAAIALAVVLTGVAELFYHWNIKTPYWLGFIFQRPESHCIHHKQGQHKNNYSDLPVWDMLFGTFHNPSSFENQCGFENNGELRVFEMLKGQDIKEDMKTGQMDIKTVLSTVFLVTLGSVQMAGDLMGLPALKGLGLATVASPAPKVFTAQNGFETYANKFFIDYLTSEGKQTSIEITPKVYQRLKGPYNRKNIYGAATSYAPVLARNPKTKPMLISVLHYAFCGDAPLLIELGAQPKQAGTNIQVRLEPIGANKGTSNWPLTIETHCDA